MRLVVDASVTLAWCLKDEDNQYAARVLRDLDAGNEAVVPGLWPLEVANSLLMAERRGRLSRSDIPTLARMLRALPIVVLAFTVERSLGAVIDTARTHRLTAYDAAYLDLAFREGLPLATLDTALRAAARHADVILIGE